MKERILDYAQGHYDRPYEPKPGGTGLIALGCFGVVMSASDLAAFTSTFAARNDVSAFACLDVMLLLPCAAVLASALSYRATHRLTHAQDSRLLWCAIPPFFLAVANMLFALLLIWRG